MRNSELQALVDQAGELIEEIATADDLSVARRTTALQSLKTSCENELEDLEDADDEDDDG